MATLVATAEEAVENSCRLSVASCQFFVMVTHACESVYVPCAMENLLIDVAFAPQIPSEFKLGILF